MMLPTSHHLTVVVALGGPLTVGREALQGDVTSYDECVIVPTTYLATCMFGERTKGDRRVGTSRLCAGSGPPLTTGHSRVFARGRFGQPLMRVSLGLVISGLMVGFTSLPAVNAGAASTIKSNKPYAQAQLLKLSNLPPGWTKTDKVWVGTSADNNSSSMLTMTQYPDLSTCMGNPPALSVIAAEASSPNFYSKDQSTNVVDVADVYTDTNEAKSDFPPLNSPKLANCLLQVEGSGITSVEQSQWPSGATFGTMTASVSHQPRYGDESGLVEVQVPVNLPGEQGSTNDFLVVLVIRQGRSTAELQIDQSGTPPSAVLTESLAKAAIAKMKARSAGQHSRRCLNEVASDGGAHR